MAHLLDFAVCETTYWLLDDLIKKAPDVAVAGNKLDFSSDLSATYQKASDYIRHVAVQLGFRTDRQIMFANLMESAIGDAEAIIKGIPPNDRPPHIDQLDLRKFAIADLQAKRAIIFLIGQRREVLEKLIAMRHKLIELSRDWSNGNSNCISRFLANASGA